MTEDASDAKAAAVEAQIALHRREIAKNAINRVLIGVVLVILLIATCISAVGAYEARENAIGVKATQAADHRATAAQNTKNTEILNSLSRTLADQSTALKNHTQSIDAIANLQADLDHKFIVVFTTLCKANPTSVCTELIHRLKSEHHPVTSK